MVCELSRDDLMTLLKDHPADKELLNPYLSQPPHVHLLTSERMLQMPLFTGLSETAWEARPPKVSDKKDKAADKKGEAKKIKQMIRVGHLAAGAIAGELAMLGISQTRSASIQAATLCVFWEVTQERAMMILDRFPEELLGSLGGGSVGGWWLVMAGGW
eukprot:Skav215313  [mRNA]  locus=scaffold2444:89308:98971:+ [translate_table: standard]